MSDDRGLSAVSQRGVAAFALAMASVEGPAVAEETRQAKFGTLTVTYDPKGWSLAPETGGFTAVCRVESCRGRTIVGTIRPGERCDGDDRTTKRRGGRRDVGTETAGQGGLVWVVARWWKGCRNAHPRSIAACASHGGESYHVDASLASCRTGSGYGAEDAILTLIRGIAP